jgi:hypothetical protein
MATTDPWYQLLQWNNGGWEPIATQDKAAAQKAVDAANAKGVGKGQVRQTFSLTPVDMSLATNAKNLGLSDQSIANVIASYQYRTKINPKGAAYSRTGPTSPTIQTIPLSAITPEDRTRLGISGGSNYITQFDPTKPNWNANSWALANPSSTGLGDIAKAVITTWGPVLAGGLMSGALGTGASAAGSAASGAVGVGTGISDAATQAAIDSIMGNTTNMIGANLAGAGFDVGAGLGVAGAATNGLLSGVTDGTLPGNSLGVMAPDASASTGVLGTSTPIPTGGFTPGADISSGYGFQPGADISSGYGFQPGADISSGYPAAQGGYAAGTNPYIGNSISDLAVTNPTGTVPTNSLFQNAQAALGGNYSTAAGNPLSGLVSNGSGILGSGGTNVATDSLIPGISNSDLLGGGLKLIGGIVGGNAATDAAKTAADAQLQAAKIAADAAKFKPVGITTNFGKSQFGYDANGNLTSAGYQLSPQLQAQQNAIMAGTNPLLTQALGAQAATAPMGDAAQRMMTLGNGYLASTPQEQAAKWLADQRALLTQGDQSNYAQLQAQLQASGRGGLMTGGGNGFAAANPELNAYYNAMQQRDLGLAANATQQGQQYATYGANLVGSGGQMLDSMYSTQSNAYNPYKTALGQASTIEGLGQNALDQGINLGAKGTAATAQSGMLLGQGMSNAAQTMQQANAYSPWATGLSNLGNLFQQSGAQAQPQGYQFNPYTGKSLLG